MRKTPDMAPIRRMGAGTYDSAAMKKAAPSLVAGRRFEGEVLSPKLDLPIRFQDSINDTHASICRDECTLCPSVGEGEDTVIEEKSQTRALSAY